jgi:hypothetical protein
VKRRGEMIRRLMRRRKLLEERKRRTRYYRLNGHGTALSSWYRGLF